MALHKFSKTKAFHVDYCGCTAAAFLRNESSIRDAIQFIRQEKSKRECVKTTLSTSKAGVKIKYENELKFSTHVPALMIAGSAMGKASLNDTIGVVYISPLTGDHYPAFVHVYRCDSSRTAQKLLARLRSYSLVESHRLRIAQLEQQLLDHNLLNCDHHSAAKLSSLSPTTNALNSSKTDTAVSSSSTSSGSQQDKVDAVKSITEELQKKLDSQQPLLFPPKDYDTIHVSHGNVQRAQAWKSREPTIVGITPIDPDKNRAKRQTQSNQKSPVRDVGKVQMKNDIEATARRSYSSTQTNDLGLDPVETVSLAFDFLKDETDSIGNETDGNIEHLEVEQQDKPAVFRFRPPQITAITKKLFTRNNTFDLANNVQRLDPSARHDLDNYYNKAHRQAPSAHRARSETNLHYSSQAALHLSPRYESRLASGSGIPISTNPLWSPTTTVTVGSQPNLLTQTESHPRETVHYHFSPTTERRMTSVPLQHPLYASYPNNKPTVHTRADHSHKRPAPPLPTVDSTKKLAPKIQYLDTNEFILRASDGPPTKNSQYTSRPATETTRDNRSNATHTHGNTMLDVYY